MSDPQSLKPPAETDDEALDHPSGTYAPHRIASAERDRWRTDQFMGDGRDPNFAHAASDGHEPIPSAGEASHAPAGRPHNPSKG